MFGSLLGAEMPLAVRFFLAFLIVLGLIGATAWAVRRFGSGRLGGTSARGRQPRLGVIDHASVDARRRLILVRRDNVEHLLMIGGPTDVVVESNIVRAAASAPRDVPMVRGPAGVEPMPRAIPLPENGGASWPLQPEPVAPAALPPASPPSRPAPRLEPEEAAWPTLQPQAEAPGQPGRPARETLAALADELAARPSPPRSRAPSTMRTPPIEPREPRIEPRGEPRIEARPEPRLEAPQEPRVEPRIPAAPQPPAAEDEAADQSLAEMAHRLEAALRKPNAQPEQREPRAPMPRAARPTEPMPERAPPPPRPARSMEPRPARPAEPRPSQGSSQVPNQGSNQAPNQGSSQGSSQGKGLYDSLEQEMASLLGRPTNKN